ncbi:MAG: peptide deformylase [Patescibacteria group bacterium]|nr:peptide deformylase [Patescibacteria group bacterium]
MKILDIKKFNNPVLRKKSEEIKEVDQKTRELMENMAYTMQENKGIGLAAPQVGVLKRVIIVVDIENQQVLALANPKILNKSKETEIEEEGCLSFPNIFIKIKRAVGVEIEALDINNRKIQLNAKGFFAREFQHEIDHLNGILFFNRLDFIHKLIFKLRHPFLKM